MSKDTFEIQLTPTHVGVLIDNLQRHLEGLEEVSEEDRDADTLNEIEATNDLLSFATQANKHFEES